jgi:hypothetical protein
MPWVQFLASKKKRQKNNQNAVHAASGCYVFSISPNPEKIPYSFLFRLNIFDKNAS